MSQAATLSRAGAHDLAARLERAEGRAEAIEPLVAGHPELTIADAYEVQRAGLVSRLRAGRRVVGHKIGLTSAAMQEMLGVGQPDFGYLLDTMVLDSGAEVDAGRLIAPRVEAEIAFILQQGLRGPVTQEAVLAATGSVAPAIEVIDSRVADWQITIVDTIADNASSAAAVVGAPMPLDELDLAALGMTLTVGGEEVSGLGAAVLGHPAQAVAWLVNAMADFGEGLNAGEVVLPGAMARALPVGAGDVAQADFGVLGSVSVRFGGDRDG